MAFSKPISNKLKWQRRWFVCLLLSLCLLPLVSQVAKLLKLHADDALVNNEQLLLPYLLGNGKKKKQHHRHPLSRENENITEADLLNRCCIWLVKRDEAFKQRVYASYASGMCLCYSQGVSMAIKMNAVCFSFSSHLLQYMADGTSKHLTGRTQIPSILLRSKALHRKSEQAKMKI